MAHHPPWLGGFRVSVHIMLYQIWPQQYTYHLKFGMVYTCLYHPLMVILEMVYDLGLPPYPVRESTVAMEHIRNLFYRICNGHVWFPKSFVVIFPPFSHHFSTIWAHHVTFFTIGTSPCLPRVMADVRRTSESKLWRASSCVSQRKMDGDDRGF